MSVFVTCVTPETSEVCLGPRGVTETPTCGTDPYHAPTVLPGSLHEIVPCVRGLTFGEHQGCRQEDENPKFREGHPRRRMIGSHPCPRPLTALLIFALCDDLCIVWLHAHWVSKEKRWIYRRQPSPRGEVRAPVPALGNQGTGALHRLGLFQEGQRGPGGAGPRRC